VQIVYALGESWNEFCLLSRIQRKSERRANLLHPRHAQVSDASSWPRLSYGNSVMQVDSAGALHSIIDIQNHRGRHAANRRRDRRHGDGREMPKRAVAGEHQNRPLLTRGRKVATADLAPAQRSGHAETSSQARNSSSVCGLARYPRRSCPSNSGSRKRFRCRCRASRMSADRLTLPRAATSAPQPDRERAEVNRGSGLSQ
jgi:hypothetical protein